MTANAAQDDLFSFLAELGIATTTVPYPAHASVEEGSARRGDLPGRFTKNLLLRDKQHQLYLIVAGEDQALDLKTFHRLIGARGRLSFADPAQMQTLLGVEPGALTPLGLMHDDRCVVRLVLDEALLEADVVNFHPLVNTESTSIKPHDLLRFIRATGREPLLVRLSEPMSVDDAEGETAMPRTVEELLTDARARFVRLTPAQAAAAQASGALLIDIRGDDQRRNQGCIPGAIRIPRNVLEWRADPGCPSRDARVSDREAILVVVCQEGYQSSLAASVLHDFGFARATDLEGGFEAWSAAGLPVEDVTIEEPPHTQR